jgi:hypothetical protein
VRTTRVSDDEWPQHGRDVGEPWQQHHGLQVEHHKIAGFGPSDLLESKFVVVECARQFADKPSSFVVGVEPRRGPPDRGQRVTNSHVVIRVSRCRPEHLIRWVSDRVDLGDQLKKFIRIAGHRPDPRKKLQDQYLVPGTFEDLD